MTESGAGEPLCLRAHEAAVMLGVSERHLWSMTNRGEIPCVRMGRAVRYPLELLKRWLEERAQQDSRGVGR